MEFCFEKTVAAPVEKLFAFHEDPEHLRLLHQGWSSVRLLHSDGKVKVGGRIWVEIGIGGILPVVLGFEFTHYDPPFSFAERMIHGPFQLFTHKHEFQAAANGGILRDVLHIELPMQYGGEAVLRKLIAPAIVKAFQQRADALERLVHRGCLG